MGVFFSSFSKIVPLTILWFTTQVIILIGCIPFLIVFECISPKPTEPYQLWLLLAAYIYFFIVLLIYLFFATRWTFAIALIFHRDLSGIGAMRTSWEMTKGHFWGMLGINIDISIGLFGLPMMMIWPAYFFQYSDSRRRLS
ncbi:MAG: hypothetical protein EBV06_11955 [Planctomycetia bacterium]|nr:hypothetical protein [Planctomycetia bacterium]